MLESVTFFDFESKSRLLDLEKYQARISADLNMQDKEHLVKYGCSIFQDSFKILKVRELPTDESKVTGVFSRLKNFTPLSDVSQEFYLKTVPNNGLSSFRKGFNMIVSYPKLFSYANKIIWQADIHFNDGFNQHLVYKYKANVGPLVNRFAVWGDLRTGKKRVLKINEKEKALAKLINKPIYISSAELVNNDYYGDAAKEILWFTLE